MEGQRPGPCQPRSKRGTSDGLGLALEMAKGLKARSNVRAHGEKWSRAFSPLDVRARKPWALPKAGMKPGPWPSIAKPVSKLRPTKIPVPRCAHSLLPAFSRKPKRPLRASAPLCEAKIPVPKREAQQRTVQRGKTKHRLARKAKSSSPR